MFRRVTAPAYRALVLQQPRTMSYARSFEVAPVYEIVSPWYRSTEVVGVASPLIQTLEVAEVLSPLNIHDGLIDTENEMKECLSSWGPEVKCTANLNSIDFEVEVPGARIAELNVDLQGTTLTISGKHEEHNNVIGPDFELNEDKNCGFIHTISVPSGLRPDMISANLDNGLLVVNVPKLTSMSRSTVSPAQIIHHIEQPIVVDEPVALLKCEQIPAEECAQISEVLQAMSEAVPVFEQRLEVSS